MSERTKWFLLHSMMLVAILLGVVGLVWAYIPIADRVGSKQAVLFAEVVQRAFLPKDSLIEPEPVEVDEAPTYDPRWDLRGSRR